ncbi:MAG: hypothetical protein IT294_02905 [Deltaproteobacteria bacterium]|nr:hypothetical protein [Deltaproteobacteria bacterium]
MTPTDTLCTMGRAALFALVVVLAACSKPTLPGDLEVADITTGRELAPDGGIKEDARTNMFWATDTFYVSVRTNGSAQNVTMTARWSGPENAKAEVSKTLSPKGPTTTTLEAPPPNGRWPAGDYTVEILVNGGSQGIRELNAR